MPETKLVIHRNFDRPSPGLLDRLRNVPTGPVVDAMGRRGALDRDIRPLTAARRMVGTALTVSTPPRDNLAPYAALAIARPGDVLVVACAGDDECAILGDLAIGMARNAGIMGVVTNGLVRDLDGLNAVGIPVFARGLTPNSPFKNGPGEVGCTVAMGPVAIAPGDVIVADQDGVAVVPKARLEATIEAVQAILAKEKAMEEAIAAGAAKPAWLDDLLAGPDVRFVD